MRRLLHDARARIVVLVDAVAETHQAERIVLVLGPRNIFRNAIDGADLGQHVERGFVCAAMGGAPQAGDAGRNAGERIGARGAGKANRRRRRILLVVGMQDEDAVHRARQDRIDHIVLAGNCKTHAQEVRCVVEVVLRVNERLADMVLVGHCRDRRHLRNHAQRGDHTLMRIRDIRRVVIEGRQRAHAAAHYSHGVGITAEAGEKAAHLLVHHRVVRDAMIEIILLRLGRQIAVEKKVADFEEVAMFCKLLDRVTAVQKHAFIAVDIGDLRFARGRGGEAGIVGEGTRVLVECADVDHIGADRPGSRRQLDCLATDRYVRAFSCHNDPPLFRMAASGCTGATNMPVLLAHLRCPAKRYERQIVHCGNRLSGNAISTL